MVSRKGNPDEIGNALESAREAARAAAHAATPREEAPAVERKPQAGKVVTLRIDPIELEELRRTFGSYGVTLAGGMKVSAHYVMRELKAGRLDLSKAGLQPGERGR
jgi:hypothetical protein